MAEDVSPVPRRRKQLPHDVPLWVPDGEVFFITICCMPRGVNQLCNPTTAHIVFESVQFRQDRGDWYVHIVLLMPDHLHALVSFPRDRSMRTVIASWKEFLAKRASISWQRDFFDHRLRDRNYIAKANYIRMNPVKKNLTTDPASWPFVWEPALD